MLKVCHIPTQQIFHIGIETKHIVDANAYYPKEIFGKYYDFIMSKIQRIIEILNQGFDITTTPSTIDKVILTEYTGKLSKLINGLYDPIYNLEFMYKGDVGISSSITINPKYVANPNGISLAEIFGDYYDLMCHKMTQRLKDINLYPKPKDNVPEIVTDILITDIIQSIKVDMTECRHAFNNHMSNMHNYLYMLKRRLEK